MDTIEKLEKLQNYMIILEKNNKIIKNGSYLYLLKKMKKSYEKTKEKYLKDKEKLQKLKEQYENVSGEIKKLRKDINEKVIYRDIELKELTDDSKKNIKRRIGILEQEIGTILIKSEELVEIIEKLRIKLINDKNNYSSFKEKVENEISTARNQIENTTILVQNMKKDISEYLYNKFISIYKISGVGIVKNKNGICSNCKNSILEYLNAEAIDNMEIISCPVCGGILYINSINRKIISKISV